MDAVVSLVVMVVEGLEVRDLYSGVLYSTYSKRFNSQSHAK